MGDWSRVPVINVKDIGTCSKARERISKEVHDACKNVGFFYIINHDIPISLQNQMESFSKQFFSKSPDEKLEIDMKKAGLQWRGYFPVGGELTSGRIDQKEGIYFGVEHESTNKFVQNKTPMHGKNQWPKDPPQLCDIVTKYMNLLIELGHLLMTTIALGLGLREDYFRKRFTDSPTVLFRIFNYPEHKFLDQDDEWGVREHTDMGFLTILKQDSSGGLEVKNKVGQWIEAPPIENSFVVNIGDMLEVWTHGLYRATLHRVKNKANHDRLSFPLFFDPNWDASLQPINSDLLHFDNQFTSSSDRWDKLDLQTVAGQTYGEFVWNKIAKVFPNLASSEQ